MTGQSGRLVSVYLFGFKFGKALICLVFDNEWKVVELR
jgi:hypothetical protein